MSFWCWFRHRWTIWQDRGVVELFTTHLDSGVKVKTGRRLVQERRCRRCNAAQYRRVSM